MQSGSAKAKCYGSCGSVLVPQHCPFWHIISLLNNLHEYFLFENENENGRDAHPEVSVDVCVHGSEVNHHLLHVHFVVFLVIYCIEYFLQTNLSSFHPFIMQGINNYHLGP